MRVKEFNDYRAPKRHPWIPITLLLVIVVGVVWYVRRPDREVEPSAVANERSDVEETTPDSGGGARQRPDGAAGSDETNRDAEREPMPEDISELMEEAAALQEADRLQPARELYQRALEMATDDDTRQKVEDALGAVHIELLFSQRSMPEKEEYLIQSGDQLRLLARRFGTTTELIQRGNNIRDPNRIRIGDRLLIFSGDFEIVANKTRRDMVVYLNGEFFKRYQIGTGEHGKTPVGTFVIRDKIKEPSWWPSDGREVPFGDPDNVLGTRWLAIQATGDTPRVRGYGIHGTWEPESIGHEESDGCIRMHNEEVEELYVYIPSGTPVRIEE